MATIVRKWGNSLGIRLPKGVAEQAQLTDGTEVEFETSGGVLKIRPRRRGRYTLAGLLAKAKGPSPHRRLNQDGPVGRELI
jgi:antitoxin MazE